MLSEAFSGLRQIKSAPLVIYHYILYNFQCTCAQRSIKKRAKPHRNIENKGKQNVFYTLKPALRK